MYNVPIIVLRVEPERSQSVAECRHDLRPQLKLTVKCQQRRRSAARRPISPSAVVLPRTRQEASPELRRRTSWGLTERTHRLLSGRRRPAEAAPKR